MDRGYIDWKRLYRINQANAFFVIRANAYSGVFGSYPLLVELISLSRQLPAYAVYLSRRGLGKMALLKDAI